MTLPIARLPVVDLHGCRAGGDAEAQACAARAIDAACRDTGFLVLEQHGVPDAVLQDAFEAAFAFFDAPQAVKDSARPPDGRVRGYTPLQGQRLARSLQHETPPDLFERFRLGAFGHPQDAYHQARAQGWFAPNVWPPELPQLRTALEAYYRAMEQFAADLMRLFALALDLLPGHFEPFIDRHISSLCLNHYPALEVPPEPGQLRAGAHTDYGSLTIVASTGAPGRLEVRLRGGDWAEVALAPGQLVVNIGDLMAQWTNDRWVSTLHRVGNPPPGAGASGRRLSLVFFHQPNDDALIECLPSCLAPGAGPLHPPITSGEHLGLKIQRHLAPPSPTP